MRKILPWIYVNGSVVLQERAMLSVLDDGFQYGYGFFTTLKVREGIPLFLDQHLLRLDVSAKQLGIALDQSSRKSIGNGIKSIIEKNELTEGAIRVTVTKGTVGNPTIVIHATTIDKEIHTVQVITVLDERDLYKTIKMTYRVPHMIAMQKAQEHGASDALFFQNGFLIESTYANIYACTEESTIITPSITGRALDSISRKILFQQLVIAEQEIPESTKMPLVLVSSLSIRIVEKINGNPIKKDEAFVSKIQTAITTAEDLFIAASKK
ncbi:MAG TPA: aminotransferase class IV [Candidatus Saccharimonadales bacterium]|nr:aminotransferase class IV [Candidatus Saccharimonadales bacterium]